MLTAMLDPLAQWLRERLLLELRARLAQVPLIRVVDAPTLFGLDPDGDQQLAGVEPEGPASLSLAQWLCFDTPGLEPTEYLDVLHQGNGLVLADATVADLPYDWTDAELAELPRAVAQWRAFLRQVVGHDV